MRLTKTAIDKATYQGEGKKRFVLWDDALPGFGLRIYPSGRKTFVVFYRSASRQRFMSLGMYGVLTLSQARDQARRILVEAREGNDPLQSRQDSLHAQTVSAFCEHYLEQHARPKKKSWKEDERRIHRYIKPAIGKLALEKVSREDINRIYHQVGSKKPYEANRLLALLSTMFNLAKSWGLLPEGGSNPAKIPKSQRFKEKVRDRPVTSAELPKLLQAISEEEDVHAQAAFRLYLLTGLRKRELLHSRWNDLDPERGTLRLPDTKGGKPRHVPLSQAAIGILASLPRMATNPYIFPSPMKDDIPRNDLFKRWRRIRQQAGCHDLRIHDLRHSVATWLAEEGNAAVFIQQALGHQSLQTTMRYIHAANAGPRQALEGLGERLRDRFLTEPQDALEPVSEGG